MEKEKLYKIYYGEGDQDYLRRYLKEGDIIDGYLSESKAFDIFYDNMILCNNYFDNNDFCNIDYLIDPYDEKEDYYIDEYQIFIVDPTYNEEITTKATEKMRNTLYYDNEKDLYITGITDLGTSRTIVATDLKVEEVKGVQKNV